MNYKQFKIGIELECLIDYDSHADFINEVDMLPHNRYSVGDDGSISGEGEGIEIRANGALTYRQFKTSISSLCRVMKKYNVFVNNSCGYHVHVSNQRFFDATNIKRIVFLWSAIEDVVLATQPKSRINNNYCKRYLLQYLEDQKNPVPLPKAKSRLIETLHDRNRYQTMNLQALQDHGTIEIRVHAGTTQVTKVVNWVEFLLNMYSYALTKYKHKDVLELFNMPISEDKITRTFELLSLPKNVAAFYEKRIDKFMFTLLQKQQESAGKVLGNMKAIRKARRVIEKKRAELGVIETAYRQEYEVIQQIQN